MSETPRRIPANPVEEAFREERRQRQLLAACASGAQKKPGRSGGGIRIALWAAGKSL